MTDMIVIKSLSKRFGPILAVDGVSFTVARGEVLGFLGPNGAGKSTTMKMITGFLTPSGGTAEVCGQDVQRDPVGVKKRLGYLPEGAPAYPDMTPAAFLDFIGAIRGFDGAERRRRVEQSIERVQLQGVLNQPIETLSKGFKRRVGLAQALLHDPEVLILDEPTDGLDPNQKHEVRNLIAGMAKEKAIIISTHILEEVDAVCTRAVIIARGKVVADGTPDALEARSRYHNAVSMTVRADALAAALTGLQKLPAVSAVEHNQSVNGVAQIIAFPRDGRPILGEISSFAREAQLPVEQVRLERGRLDEVFRRVTAGLG